MPQILDTAQSAPPTLDHVIGQKRAIRQLKTALEAHFADRADAQHGNAPSFPHVLLVGPPGLGKSMMSSIIAKELGGRLHEELAQNITSAPQLHGLLMLPDDGDCVFVDEIHELHSMAQTGLYRCLEEGRLFLQPGPDGERRSLILPPFTFVAATTDEWSLTKPLRDRFKLLLRLEHYDADDLAQLVDQRSRRLGWTISDAAIRGIAKRGRGTPRIALRLLEATRRSARAEGSSSITVRHFQQMCDIEGIDCLGLDPLEQKYLRIMHDASDGHVRLNVLATRLGVPRQTIEKVIEADLIRLGLVNKSDSGRCLTAEGKKHVRSLR